MGSVVNVRGLTGMLQSPRPGLRPAMPAIEFHDWPIASDEREREVDGIRAQSSPGTVASGVGAAAPHSKTTAERGNILESTFQPFAGATQQHLRIIFTIGSPFTQAQASPAAKRRLPARTRWGDR